MADETFELYSLTSKLTMDTSQFDRAYGESQKKARSLSGDLKTLEKSAKDTSSSFKGDLSSALSGISPQLAGLGTAGVSGLAIAGLGGIIGAITSLAAGVWDITTKFVEMGGGLKDMSQQVNFSVETLSGLSAIGKTAGADIDSLSGSLVKFQKNLATGNDAFKILGITSKDNEVALRQAFKALNDIADGATQSALAQEIFGKSGRNMLGVIKEVNGDFDEAMARLKKWGLIMGTENAEAADEFGDRLDTLGLRARGIANQLATETTPAFTAFFVAIEAALDANETNWKSWGEFLAKTILTIETAIGGFAYAVSKIDWSNLVPGYGAAKFWYEFIQGAKLTADKIVPEYVKRTAEPTVGVDVSLPPSMRPGAGIHLGDKDKEKKVAAPKEDPAIRLLERYENQLRSLTPITEEQRAATELLNKEYAKSPQAYKDLIMVTAKIIDVKKATKEASEKAEQQQKREADAMESFTQRQTEALRQLFLGQKTARDEVNDFRVAYFRLGGVMDENQLKWIQLNAHLLDTVKNADRLAAALENIENIGPPELKLPELPGGHPSTNDIRHENGEAFPIPKPMEETLRLKWKRITDDVASDITYTIDRAIHAGFESGVGAGVKEFLLGIAEMIESQALKELQAAIAKAIGGGMTGDEQGSGGSGFLAKLIGVGLGAITSLFGGGGGGGLGSSAADAIGGHAGGGFMRPNEWSWVGERGPELVKAGPRGASVMSNEESTRSMTNAMVVNQYIQVASMYEAGNRRTQTQALRGLHQAAQRGQTLRG